MTAEAAQNLHAEEEDIAHTHAISTIIESGDDQEVRMILGDRDSVRYAGKIRAGIKVPKSNTTAAEKRRYEDLAAQGMPFDEIDRQLGGTPKSKNSKLRPTNVDYFVIRECDFKSPADAAYIREKYADADGKVRRLPIWFMRDQIDQVIPHRFRAFDGAGNVRASSFYDEDGNLAFRYLPKGKKDKSDWTEMNIGRMSEDGLIEAVETACGNKIAFGGLYKVNVVGLKTFGEIIVPTQSWHGLADAVAVLKLVKSVLGRFNGLVGGEHFLVLTKVPHEVRDPDGKRQTQHIITIDADVDPMDLARHAEGAADRGLAAIGMFNGAHKSGGGQAQQQPLPRKSPAKETTPASKPEAPAQSSDVESAIQAIYALASKGGIDRREIDAFIFNQSGDHLENEKDIEALRGFYKLINGNIRADAEGFRAHCNDLLNGGGEDPLPFE